MRSMVVSALLGSLVFAAAASAGSVLVNSPTSPPIVSPGPVLSGFGSLDPTRDFDRRYTNGIREYRFAPPADWSPLPDPDRPKPAFLTAYEFLQENAASLDVYQNLSAFKYVGSDILCDGTEVVRFQQTYALIPVETSRFEFQVRDEIVTYVDARFIEDVSMLPVCQPQVLPDDEVEAHFYLPETVQTLVVVVMADRVGFGQKVRRIQDACSGIILGYSSYP